MNDEYSDHLSDEQTVSDDGYGRNWSYRLFSQTYTEPDVPETGKRYLTAHRVDWRRRPPRDWPLEDDVVFIEDTPAAAGGVELEAWLLDAERILQAADKPTLIRSEWRRFFDHSAKCRAENETRLAQLKGTEP
jgi:hypothetical protein